MSEVFDSIEAREREKTARLKIVQRKRERLSIFVEIAQRHVAIWEQYERLRAAWQSQQYNLAIWQPWQAHEIRIVATGKRVTCGTGEDEDGVETLMVLEEPEQVARRLADDGAASVTVLQIDGELRSAKILLAPQSPRMF